MTRKRVGGFTLVELLIVVAIIGILSAIAVPVYFRFLRRSQTAEATNNLLLIYSGMVSYYDAEHNDVNGKVVNHLFPPSIGYTPATLCCAGVEAKCAPDEVPWRAPTWEALGFLMQDFHRYRYAAVRIAGDGTAIGNRVDMYALGDLNCDGVYGVFTRSATIGPGFAMQSPGTTSVNELQ